MQTRSVLGIGAILLIGAVISLVVLLAGRSQRASMNEVASPSVAWWPSETAEDQMQTIAPGQSPTDDATSSQAPKAEVYPGPGTDSPTIPALVLTVTSTLPTTLTSSNAQAVAALPENPLACLPPGAAEDPAGDIVVIRWVQDGASLVVDRHGASQTVRLIGVDPPPAARRALDALLNGAPVRLISDGQDTDSVGRLRRYALTLDGRLINYELLARGDARLDTRSEDYDCREIFAAAEQHARTAQIGIWGLRAAAVPPTDTRVPTPTLNQTTPLALLPTPSLPSTATVGTTTPTATLNPGQTASFNTPTSTQSSSGSIPTTERPTTTTPTSTRSSTPTATPPGEGTSIGPMIITNIFVIGTASKNEADEYIEIKNTGQTEFSLGGWSLYSDSSFAEIYFPSDFSLGAGMWCRVYTNEIHPESCAGLSFGKNQPAWDNEFDCGGLYNEQEESISEFCYDLALGGT